MATKERLAAMAASLCAVCSGQMMCKVVTTSSQDNGLELRTYDCTDCGHTQTYSIDAGAG